MCSPGKLCRFFPQNVGIYRYVSNNTKVKVEGSLKDGKPSGSFSIEKPSVDPATLKAMIQGITTLFKG
jgi:hypothetical protein